MSVATVSAEVTEAEVRRALHVVLDPELDEPITDLGFVRSVAVHDSTIEVHLRLPTSFCSPNFAYLMASDSKDALTAAAPGWRVVVELDDHHDSDLINRGLAADAGYLGTFGHEAEKDLEDLRAIFRRKAHTAALERALTAYLREHRDLDAGAAAGVRLGDLPPGPQRDALLRRREALGLPDTDDALVLVDEHGNGCSEVEAPLQLRLARSTRISIDGNAHFCRGLLATRYPGSEADQAPREPDPTFIPLSTLKEQIP